MLKFFGTVLFKKVMQFEMQCLRWGLPMKWLNIIMCIDSVENISRACFTKQNNCTTLVCNLNDICAINELQNFGIRVILLFFSVQR